MQKIKDLIYYNRKEIILSISFIFIFFTYAFFNNKSNDVIISEELNTIENEVDNKIIVDIKGEVISPGTYEFDSGERISDAIKKCGGLTINANVESINLSEKLKDEMLLVIPSKDEINEVNVKEDNKKQTKESIVDKQNTNDGKISINTASIKELMTLNGIGEKKAEAIVEYRNKNGLFKDIKDITKVSGIGNSLFDKIKDNIKV